MCLGSLRKTTFGVSSTRRAFCRSRMGRLGLRERVCCLRVMLWIATSVRLGEGEEAYERAIKALREWRPFDLEWVCILLLKAPLEVGTTVGVLARHYGFWSLNSAPYRVLR